MAMRVLITGGAGFIGSHLAERLLGQGHEVVLVDDLSTGRRENVAHLPGDRCELIEAAVGELDADGSWLAGVDRTYHLAAAVGVQRVVDRPVSCIENNVVDTARLLRAAARRRVPTLIASSSEVYGKSCSVPFGEDDDVTYGGTIYSRWAYAMTKALDEHLALAHYRTEGLAVVIARLFNTVGPRQTGRYGMVLPRMIHRAVSGQPIQVYGDGRQTRCFCHVSDVVEALARLLGCAECHGRVFNVGSDEEWSIDAVADRVLELTGSTAGKTYLPYEQAYGAAFDDLRRRVPDLSRVRRAIGFEPTRSLDEILRELVDRARPSGDRAGEQAQHA